MHRPQTATAADVPQDAGPPITAGTPRRTPLRRIIFWLHLTTGIVAGLVIGLMAFTGVLLSFERQITAWAERDVRVVPPPAATATRLDLDRLMAQARRAVPEGRPSGVVLSATPTAAVQINFGRERALFLHPYTGEIVGEGATGLRTVFHTITDWHRWLGREGESREIGRAITGACNLAFLGMVVSGLYLWWPRRWTRRLLAAITIPTCTVHGRARAWQWHHVAGFWSAAVLCAIISTGVIMSYQWATHLLYLLTGNPPPPVEARPERREAPGGQMTPPPARLEAILSTAVQQAPHWRTMTLRLPARGTPQMTVMVEEALAWHPFPRSILTLDTATAAVIRWEPYSSFNLGRTLRAWVRPLHTGEAAGVGGQLIAALASSATLLLLWTGLALTWRRMRGPRRP